MTSPLNLTISSVGYTSAAGTGLQTFLQQVQTGSFSETISQYDPQGYLGTKGLRYLNRATLLYCNLAFQCIHNRQELAGFIQEKPHRVGLYDGSDLSNIEDGFIFDLVAKVEGPDMASPMSAPNTIDNASSSQMAIKAQIKGPNVTVCGGICGSFQALDMSAMHLTQSKIDYGIIGTTEVTSRYHQAVRRGEQRSTTLPTAGELGISFGVERSGDVLDGDAQSNYGRILAIQSGQRLRQETNETLLTRLITGCLEQVAQPAIDYCIVGGGAFNLDPAQFRLALANAAVQAPVLFPETLYGAGDNAGGFAGVLFGWGLQHQTWSALPAAYYDGRYNVAAPPSPEKGQHLVCTIDRSGYGMAILITKQ